MVRTRSMVKNQSQINPRDSPTLSQQPPSKPPARLKQPASVTSALEPSAPDSHSAALQKVQDEDFIDNLFAELRLKLDSETAKTNLLRLFYLKETRPFMTQKLYDDIEDPIFRANVKLAVCFLLSDDSQLPKLFHTIGELFWKIRSILTERNEHVDLISGVGLPVQPVERQLADLQSRFIDVVKSRLPSEDTFQQLAERFIEGDDLNSQDIFPTTREEAALYLQGCYGAEYTDYDWSVHSLRLMRLCLSRSYEG
jgi:hypothetical protein